MGELTTMPKYEAYKDSGVEWLGTIPQDWELLSVKHIYRLVMEESGKNHDLELLSVYSDIGVKPRAELEEKGNKASSTDGYWLVKKGDFVVNKLLAWMGGLGLSMYDGVTSPAYDILRPKRDICGQYFNYLFRSPICTSELKKHSRGIMDMRLRLYFDKFGVVKVPFPKVEVQTAIANFLDKKIAQIDEAIGIKEKQIELLKERKKIIIQQAVTQGLDSNAPMKHSGVDWIGHIPEHWEVKKLKYLLSSPLKYGANESGMEYDEDLPRYVRITDFSGDGKLSDKNKLSLKWSIGKNYLLNDGDILLARSGATVGKSYQFKASMSQEEHYCFAGYLIRARSDALKILSDYLNLFLSSECFTEWKSFIFNKATIENIGADKYSELKLSVPDLAEQKSILIDVGNKSKPIDEAIKLNQVQIEKLKEYKTTLINSAVTGKIKVI